MEELYYTFFYCKRHDDGLVILGNHLYLPENYLIDHSNKCDSSDWQNTGIIKYNGYTFDIIEPVRINYDLFNGGFMFSYYKENIIDDKLKEWIDKVSINEKNIYAT